MIQHLMDLIEKGSPLSYFGLFLIGLILALHLIDSLLKKIANRKQNEDNKHGK